MSSRTTRSPLTPDRNTSRSKVIPEELDKRKTLLWCMLNVEHRLVRIIAFFVLHLG